jgi:hypothetical protein
VKGIQFLHCNPFNSLFLSLSLSVDFFFSFSTSFSLPHHHGSFPIFASHLLHDYSCFLLSTPTCCETAISPFGCGPSAAQTGLVAYPQLALQPGGHSAQLRGRCLVPERHFGVERRVLLSEQGLDGVPQQERH